MTKTRAELVTRALLKLEVIGEGQSPSAGESEKADSVVDGLIASLRSRDIVDVEDVEEIPIEWFEQLADCLAYASGSDFGRGGDTVLLGKKQMAESELRVMTSGGPTYEVMRAEYF